MESDKMSNVARDLGFLEKIDQSDCWQLESRFFPSKVGGKPAWLDLKSLPPSSLILCPLCNLPRSFLCQLYANIDEKPECFHRTLFIFMCRSNKVRYFDVTFQRFSLILCPHLTLMNVSQNLPLLLVPQGKSTK